MKQRFLLFLAVMLIGLGRANAQSTYKVVDIEHHFGNRTMFDAAFLDAYGCTLDELPEEQRAIYYTTLDLGAGRIAAMDAAGVDFAQLSLSTPGAEAYGPAMGKQIAKEANDSIAKAIAAYPDRIGGWMTLYPEDVEWSLQEIDRCVNMGLYGWACRSNMKSSKNIKRLDDPKYWPIFKKLEELGMPVYLHPEDSEEGYSAESGYCINVQTTGFGADALTTFMRMVSRGLFDECPNLKIILGHVGEGFPSFKEKINASHTQGSGICNHQHDPSYYVDHNVWITTSRNTSNDVLRSCLDEMPSGHVLMSTDYPYQDLAGSVSFIRDNKKLTHREKVSLLSNNAIALGFSKLEPTNVSMDYSKSENWLKLDNNPEQNVDVFYILPTCIMQGTNEVESFSEQDKLTAAAIYEQQAKLFEGFCNIYAPYYRQIPLSVMLSECQTAEDIATNVRTRAGKDDVFAALDYYFENLNTDRPFILASHSQGSAMMRPVLDTYMKEHPEYYKRMVACYALGFSLPYDWMQENNLKWAEDATSTGVVIGWNTEGPQASKPSLLIGSNDYVINPLSWKCDGEWVSEVNNLGSLIEGSAIPGYADAQIDWTRRALICTTDINYIAVPAFGDRSLHGGDWILYWGNIQQNAKDRIANYKGFPSAEFEEESVTKQDITDIMERHEPVSLTIKRTFYKDGNYNSLCLPFSLSEENLAADDCPFKGYKALKKFVSATVTGSDADRTLHVVLENATSIEAGVPYLISWESGENITNPLFKDVTVTVDEASDIERENLNSKGTFVPVSLEKDNQSYLFLGANNTLYWPSTDDKLKGFRAYFKVTDNTKMTRVVTLE